MIIRQMNIITDPDNILMWKSIFAMINCTASLLLELAQAIA